MRKHDGLIAAEDLRGWRTTRNAPLWGTYRRYRVSSNRPPGGGVMLLEMLNILEHFPLASLEHNSAEYVRLVAEAMKRATIGQGPPCGRSALRGRAGGPARGQALRGGDGRRDPCREEGRRAAFQRGRPGPGHHARLRHGRRGQTA